MKKEQPQTTEITLSEQHKDSQLISQSKEIKNYLESGKSLTALDALELFQCWSLTQRVFDLRLKGLPIITEMVKAGTNKRIARYYLNNPES